MKSAGKKSQKKTIKLKWDLSPFYSSTKDPRIERDMKIAEKAYEDFSRNYDTKNKSYLANDKQLLEALKDYEKLHTFALPKPIIFFIFLKNIDSSDSFVTAQITLLHDRIAKASNKVTFFAISVGSIPRARQKKLLKNPKFRHFRFLLSCIFDDARYRLSVAEEKIMSLKSLPAHELWVSHTQKILGSKMVVWNKKTIPIAQAMELVSTQRTSARRKKLSRLVYDKLKEVAEFSEGEINAVFTDKKINDELRGYGKPYENTVREYRNDPRVVEQLRRTVTECFDISHRFYRLKARIMKKKKLNYCDRAATIGQIKSSYTFADSLAKVEEIFGGIDPLYKKIIRSYVEKGQIDVYPKKGKTGGAFCAGTYGNPTYVLLNHVDSLRSFTTLAHELGHALHSELSMSQGPIYSDYSTALAETASTLFEGIATDAIYESLPDKEKIILLHDKINDEIATIFRQIACFNFELELHQAIRSKGFVSKKDIAEIHNRHMSAYLGSAVDMVHDDGYMFVSWSHIRRFFYVYSYAFGQIISKVLLRNYYKDHSFWKKVEYFLSSGGNDSPENILKKIGIDVTSPSFFREGLKSIEEDISKLESLV